MEEKKASKKQMSKGKKAIINLLAVALIIGVTVAVTLALLSTTTNTVTNTFTASKNISLGLGEPDYNLEDPDGDGSATPRPKDETKPYPGNFQPGVAYDKDPTLYNITGKDDSGQLPEEWVAMRVDYYITESSTTTQKTYSQMCADGSGTKGVIEPIAFNVNVTTGSWIQVDLSQFGINDTPMYDIYVYEYKLKAVDGFNAIPAASIIDNGIDCSTYSNPTQKTTPLFEKINVKSQGKLETNGYSTASLPTFEIKVKGAAVKNSTDITLTEITGTNLTSGNSSTTDYSIVKELVDLLKDS